MVRFCNLYNISSYAVKYRCCGGIQCDFTVALNINKIFFGGNKAENVIEIKAFIDHIE